MNQTADWMVQALLRSSLGLAIAAVVVSLLIRAWRFRSPRAEQWVWLLVLAQGVIVGTFSIVIPSEWLGGIAMPAEPAAASTIEPAFREASELTTSTSVDSQQVSPIAVDQAHVRTEQDTHEVGATIIQPLPRFTFSWTLLAATIWLLGIVSCVVMGVLRYRAFLKRIRTNQTLRPEWQAEWKQLLNEVHILRPVPLLATNDIGPALCRVLAGYRVVVPVTLWSELNSGQRISILRHELAHLQYGDLWTALLARTLAVLHWFNPCAWWALSRFDAQSEFACDVAAAGNDPTIFAEVLLQLGSARAKRLAGVQSVRSGDLFERVRRLLTSPPSSPPWKGVCLLVLAVCGLAAASMRLQAMLPPPAEKPTSKENVAADTPVFEPKPRELLRIGTDNLQTRGLISDIAFSPDGKTVAASVVNMPAPTVALFDVHSGAIIKEIVPPGKIAGRADCVAFSSDPSLLAWGEYSGHLAVWNIAENRLVFREKIHPAVINDLAFSADGKLIASCSAHGTVDVRRVADLVQEYQHFAIEKAPPAAAAGGGFRSDSAGAMTLAFTPDAGRLVVGAATSSNIYICQVRDGTVLRKIEQAHGNGHSNNPSLNCLSVTPDGRQIVSSGQHTVKREQTKLRYVAKNVTLTEIRKWDIETGMRLQELNGPEDLGFGYARLSPDGKQIVVGDFSQLRFLNTNTAQAERTISLPGWWGSRPEFSPDGTLVAVRFGQSIGLFEVSTGRRLHHSEQTPNEILVSASWSPSGDRLVTGHADGGVRVWDATTGVLKWYQLLAPVISPSGWNANPAFVDFSSDSRRIVVAGRRDDPINWRDGIVAIYDAENGQLVRTIEQQSIRSAALSPDGKVVVVATSHGSIHDTHLVGIEVDTGRTLYETPPEKTRGGYWQVVSMKFQSKSKTLMLADGNSDVILLDGLTGQEQRRFVADFRPPQITQKERSKTVQMWNASFTPDGQTLITNSADSIYIWNMATGALTRTIKHPHQNGCKVCVSADGTTVATSDLYYAGDFGEDKISLFDVKTGKQVLGLDPGDNRAGVLAFSSDGAKLFTGYHRGSASVWDVRNQ